METLNCSQKGTEGQVIYGFTSPYPQVRLWDCPEQRFPLAQRMAEERQEEAREVCTAGKTPLVTHLSVTRGVSHLSSSQHLKWGGQWVDFRGKEA